MPADQHARTDPPPERIQVPVDGCPSCVVNTEEPLYSIPVAGQRKALAFYRCSDCGHRWHTSWNLG